MKYLYAIIRHIWPRRPISRWETLQVIPVYAYGKEDSHPIAHKYILRNQFGEIKTVSTEDQ